MRPEDNQPKTSITIPSRPIASATSHRMQNNTQMQSAAAGVVRNQIDAIYSNDPYHNAVTEEAPGAQPAPATESMSQPVSQTATSPVQPGPGAVNMQADNQQSTLDNPYDRTHSNDQHVADPAAWKNYHSAWQNYYQQYYERYYVGKVHEVKKNLESNSGVRVDEPDTISTDEAMHDLRSKLRGQIEEKAKKVRKSRHFIPIVAGMAVMLVFLFLQYNRTVLAAVDTYITPSKLDPSTLIIDPSASLKVSPEPKLIIPKIGVDVPIIWDADASSQSSLNAAMDNGVVWFNVKGANARPGEKGNFVVSGHSSNDWLDRGDYKFIFARLEQMKEGDTVYANYNGTRYTYTVTHTKVVKPNDVSSLMTGTDKPHMTLITCTPLGTALNRLLVFADQISPDPSAATQATTDTTSDAAAKMPSNSPTFVERIFGLRQ